MAKPMTKTEWLNWLEKAWDEAQQAAWAEKQEPVAWMWKDGTLTSDPDVADGTWTPLFTAPVHASDISQECVDETAKGEHDLWIAAARLKSTVEAAIKAGDWKVDGACDPTMDLQYLANCFSRIQNLEWVGLTDEDVHDAFNYVEMVKLLDFDRDRPEWCEAFASACEARLRNKNGGNK